MSDIEVNVGEPITDGEATLLPAAELEVLPAPQESIIPVIGYEPLDAAALLGRVAALEATVNALLQSLEGAKSPTSKKPGAK